MLAVDHLSVTLGAKLILNDVSFFLDSGESLGIVGASGSGKSTLLKTLWGLYSFQGEITYQGRSIRTISRQERRFFWQDMPMIMQNPYASFNPLWTMERSLKAALRGVRHPCYDLFELVREFGLSCDLLARYPAQLSGGECQRMAIIRALLLNPKLILADEPTSSLDAFSRKSVIDCFKRVCDDYGVSLLLVSHDLVQVQALCSSFFMIKEGAKVVDDVSFRELFESVPVLQMKRLLESTNQGEL